jgi:hypothetical protein
VEINRFSHVKLAQLAVSDRLGKARFFIGPKDNTGLSALREPRQSSGSFDVDLSSLDELAEDWGRVSLVKIDVEGAELQVLRGMENLLKLHRPTLLVEITDTFLRSLGDNAEALLRYVTQHGYTCYVCGGGEIKPLDEPLAAMPKQWNALFIHSAPLADLLQTTLPSQALRPPLQK